MKSLAPSFRAPRRLLLAACITLAWPAATLAQTPVKLKFADWMPVTHYTVVNAAHPFMEKAKELSKGAITFEYFPAEQLGKAKDALTLLQTGVADIADISPAYITDKFALSGVAELPAMFGTACQGTMAYAKLVQPAGILANNEFQPNGVHVLVSVAYAPYKVLTANRKVETVKDFSGLKLRTAGGAMDMTAGALHAVSVRLPGPDILPSLSRGTLDGTLAPLQSVKVFDLQTALKYMTTDVSLGSFITVYAISDRAWKKLPQETRDVLTAAGQYATKTHCEYVDAQEPKVIAELQKDGVKANHMAAGQLKATEDTLAKVQAEWASALDKRGRPGSAVLAQFKQAIAK